MNTQNLIIRDHIIATKDKMCLSSEHISVSNREIYVINQQHIRERANKSVKITHYVNAKTNEFVIIPQHNRVTGKRQCHRTHLYYSKIHPKFSLITIISFERTTQFYISPHRNNARNNK